MDYSARRNTNKKRHWADALKYDYISAGHSRYYSNTLNMLEVGDRV